MNTEHRYIFEKGSKKHHCPECTKKRFVRYIDTQTGEYIPERYGRCDRESKCGYFLNPYKDGYSKSIWEQEQGNKTDWKPQQPKQIKKPVNKPKRAFIPVEVFNRTRAGYEKNTFIQNLLTRVAFPFEVQDIEKVISLYHLGTVQNGYRTGANTFPFIDVQSNVRAVQVKQFDEQNHTTGTDFLHSIIEKYHTRKNKPLPEWLEAYNKNETKVSCLFGEHLLSKNPHNPVALVEAPKTDIYGTLYFGFPEQPTNLLWLAVYNLSSLNLNKCQALKGRNVYLFPDLSKGGKAFEVWSSKINEIQKHLQGTYFQISDLLEQLATEQDKEQGKDIADYLIKQDWRLFRKQNIKEIPKPEPQPVETSTREKSEKSEALEKPFLSGSHEVKEFPEWENLDNTSKSFWNNGGRGGKVGYTKHENRMPKLLICNFSSSKKLNNNRETIEKQSRNNRETIEKQLNIMAYDTEELYKTALEVMDEHQPVFVEDIGHYQKIIVALNETSRIMQEIDKIPLE